jgi:hypothetical protein
VVSALDLRKYDDPPGLQDNVEIAGNWLAAQHPLLGWALNVHWSQTPHYLAVVLALAFSVAWDQVGGGVDGCVWGGVRAGAEGWWQGRHPAQQQHLVWRAAVPTDRQQRLRKSRARAAACQAVCLLAAVCRDSRQGALQLLYWI